MSKTEKFLKWLLPHKDIVKNGILYLRRHYLTWRTTKLPRIFLHLINRPDDDRDPHDHPNWFITLVVWGGYWEAVYETPEQLRGEKPPLVRWMGPGSIGFRRAIFTHQIVKLPCKRAWTLVLFGVARRQWGFWNSNAEFIPANKYLNREDGATDE